jgi:hypothetical protein
MCPRAGRRALARLQPDRACCGGRGREGRCSMARHLRRNAERSRIGRSDCQRPVRDFPCHQRDDRGARRQRVRVNRAVANILHVWLTLTPTCKAWVAGDSPGPPAIRACLQASQSGCSVACNLRNRTLINTRYARILHPRRDPDACVLRESAGPRCSLAARKRCDRGRRCSAGADAQDQ